MKAGTLRAVKDGSRTLFTMTELRGYVFRTDATHGAIYYQAMSEVTWISVTDAAPQFGMTPGAIMNLISRNKFPVPTYKLGKKRLIDLAVLRAFFEAKKAEGLSRLARSMNG